MSYRIDSEKCIECGQCRRFCPIQKAIFINDDYQHTVAIDLCSGCGLCEAFCPVPGALVNVEQRQPTNRLKALRRVVWRSKWQFHNHPLMGSVTLEARHSLRMMKRQPLRILSPAHTL